MKDSYYESFQYGFPDNVIGAIFPVFDVKLTECIPNMEMSDECLRGYLTENCEGHYNQILNKMVPCDYSQGSWESTRLEYVLNNKGLINRLTLSEIDEVLTHCLSSSVSSLLPFLCGWDHFRSLLARPRDRTLSPLHDIDLISTIYTYFYCLKASSTLKQSTLNIFCPNPCQKAHVSCNNDPNSWDGVCFLKNSGVFDNDYTCQCTPGFHWSNANKVCIRIDNCLSTNDSIYPCNRNGTNMCLHNFGVAGKEIYICVCHFGFMGSMCEMKRDACLQRLQPQIIPGNRACQVYLKNICLPFYGTDSYECRCKRNRKNDNSQSFPNCFRIVTKCDGQVCYNNGQCTSSLDGSKALCLCGSVWSGSMCRQLKLNSWLLWEPWSYCTVTCGKGWKIRRRLCRTGNIGDCSGNDRDLKPCKRQCRRFSDRYKPTLKMIILVQISILSSIFVYVISYIRMKVEVMNMTKGIVDKDNKINDARGIARWFEHRSKVIRGNTASMRTLKSNIFQ